MNNIPDEHKDLLFSNPEKYKKFFDKTYGHGASDKVLQTMRATKEEEEKGS